MRFCRFIAEGVVHNGVFVDGALRCLDESWSFGDPLQPGPEEIPCGKGSIEFQTPVSPSKIVCVGRNYAAHAEELGNKIPAQPLLFLKAPSSLITEGEAIVLPSPSRRVDHEGELAVVIRRRCTRIATDEDAVASVFGYVCANDVTARDLQKQDVQFTRAKSFDTFCPVGRFIETSPVPPDASVVVRVNGEKRQQGRISDMIFDIPFLIRYISQNMTLEPGDLILTGTPPGVSKLLEGDVCEIEIDGVGGLTNPVSRLEHL